MTYRVSTLPNGMRVATESLPGIQSVAIAVTVDVGARHELVRQGGISHVLEHMAFKGTTRRNARQIAEEFDDIGGNLNAYTSQEHTVYYAKVLKEDVAVAVDILADILQHSVFDEEELSRERQVILQEIAMHNDTPDDLVFDHFQEQAYPGQPLGRSILGTTELVDGFRRDDLTEYMRMHYHPSRMVLTATGHVEHEHFLALAAQAFTQAAVAGAAEVVEGKYTGGGSIRNKDLEQLHLVLGLPGLSVRDKDYYALQLLSIILGGGMSSRLFQEVREKRGLAYTVQSFVYGFNDTGLLGVYAACSEDRATELLPVLCDEVMKMGAGVSAAELKRAKSQQKAAVAMMRESAGSVTEWIGRHLLVYGEYIPAERILARIDAVTSDDIARLALQVTAAGPLTLAALGPTKKLESYDAAATRFNTPRAA